MCAQKPQNDVAANTAMVNVVPHTFIHAPVFLARRITRWSVPLMSWTSNLSLASSGIFPITPFFPDHEKAISIRKLLYL